MLNIPALAKEGFVSVDKVRRRRLMLSIFGPSDSGKTEFALSVPGPKTVIALDRGIEGMLENPNPPAARLTGDLLVKVVPAPLATQMNKEDYVTYWKEFYKFYKLALSTPELKAVILDGDSDSWEVQRLAEFGRLTKVPPNLYDNVNAARRAMYARAYDSGKTFIATNRVRKVYIDKLNEATGAPIMNDSGNVVRVWNGEYERQGFGDQDYLWQVHLRAYQETHKRTGERVYCVEITKCKMNQELIGLTLKGEDCNFAGLVQTIFPDVSLQEWGFPK